MELIQLITEYIESFLRFFISINDSLDGESTASLISIPASSGGNWFLDNLTGLLFVVILFGLPIWIVLIVHYFETRKAKLLHETLQISLKSGKEIDENILKNLPGYRKKDDSPGLGFVSMGVGIGLFFLGWFIFSKILNALSGVGILLFFIGLGTFASITYYKKFNQVDNA